MVGDANDENSFRHNEKILETANCMINYHLGFLITIKRGLTL